MSVKILLLLGGVHHNFDGFAAAFQEIVGDSSHLITPTYDGDALLHLHDEEVDVVALYTCLGGAQKDGVVAEDLTTAQTGALVKWVRDGGGVLALHAATVMREGNQLLGGLLGGRFLSHPPQFDFTVTPLARQHPVIDGVGPFTVHDEFYMQETSTDVTVHMTAEDRGAVHPMVWTKEEGRGRVVYIAPGHTAGTWAAAEYQKLVRQGVVWLLGSTG
ncbi:MAG: ThuA domain-containing protein [Caldilineaceae bacterium]|nr:ThuA domain-containing protein [Caldilineaceae bacterium]HRJ43959.1 ThuA domain-containing protein [Caldilineaceae bacterium]